VPDIWLAVVEDDPPLRDALESLLTAAGFKVLSFASAEALIDARPHLSVLNCAVVDLRLPGMDGLALQEWLSREFPSVGTVIITAHGDIKMAVAAIKAGAVDFIEKPFDPTLLLDSIYEAVDRRGQHPIGRHDQALVREQLSRLTEREREIMDLMLAGHTNKAIGLRLSISHRTVESHRSRVMEKMEVRNLAALIHLMLDAKVSLYRGTVVRQFAAPVTLPI